MSINFSKLSSLSKQTSLEPRDIFMALPNKDKSYGYPRDVQTEVWKQWFAKRDEKNVIIKMNTGSGKTVVGLAILQSCLNEGKGPAVYIVPDNYLVAQVCAEAERLGIRTACDKYDANGKLIEKGQDDFFFMTKKAILVANIHKLVNGKSIFGLRSSGNVQIGSIIIDDVHACLDTIEQQYTVRIESKHQLYSQILQLFEQYQELKDNQGFYDITINQDPRINKLIPFWIWQKSCEDIRRLLTRIDYAEDPIVLFNLPLLLDNWKTCNCVISARDIEITPQGIPIAKIANFEQAERRIFMSATLADDSIFVSAMGLTKNEISNIITPEKANDIGERLILFPKHLNAQLDDTSVKQMLVAIAIKYNVVVIVPSFDRLDFWQDIAEQVEMQVLSSQDKNIESGITALKQGTFKGLTILVNKYDGIDLPDDACRFLVIDGLPNMRSEYDMVVQGMNPGDKRICREYIQKIEQGMGRGVRSNNDYCVIVFMGDKLADVIVNQGGDKFFSKATREQYNLSHQLWEQLMESGNKPTIKEVFELAGYSINRDTNWIAASKSVLATVEYDRTANVDSTAIAIRNAFDKECICRYDEAFNIIEAEKNSNTTLDDKAKGLLMQLMAEYRNFTNPVQAQEILLSAQKLNMAVLKPISGIQFEKLHSFSDNQGLSVVRYIVKNKFRSNDYLLHVYSEIDSLIFTADSSNRFEDALNNIAIMLGIHANRPDKEFGKGPDNLWAVGNMEYFIIECKNEISSRTTIISKEYCGQMREHIKWFKNLYSGNDATYVPIFIHRSNILDKTAASDQSIRVMNEELLEKFKSAVKAFAESVVHNDVVSSTQEIQKLLMQYKLNGKAIVDTYTISAK